MNKKLMVGCLSGLALAAAALLAMPGAAPAQPAPAPAVARVAVVNVIKVLNEVEETKVRHNAMAEEGKRLEAERTAKIGALTKMRQQRDNEFRKGTPQYDDFTNKILQANAEFKTWEITERAKMELTAKRNMSQMFDKIHAGVEEVAKQQGYDIVLADNFEKPTEEQLEQLDPRNLSLRLAQNNVVYAADKFDLTELVIVVLNGKFKNAGGPNK